MIFTHHHEDHVAGLVEVLRRYDVDLVLEREFDYQSPGYTLCGSALTEQGVPVLQAIAGQQIKLDEGVILA